MAAAHYMDRSIYPHGVRLLSGRFLTFSQKRSGSPVIWNSAAAELPPDPGVFFNLKNYLLAFLILLFLWYSVVKMISAFWTVNPDAAVLQVPYLLWITFYGYLNLGIMFLN